MSEFTVAGWNITLDERYDQIERIGSIIETLRRLNAEHAIDVLGLMEAAGQNGQVVADNVIGSGGNWYPHSRKRLNEHIGMAGLALTGMESLDLGHHKTAAFGYQDTTLVSTVHLRKHQKYLPPGPEQINQTKKLLERFEGEPSGVIMIDPNCIPGTLPRRMIRSAGFKSVFTFTDQSKPYTFPAPGFEALATPLQRAALRLVGGIWLDDIYVKGLDVIDSGSGYGAADHPYVWATVAPKND